MTYLLHNMTDMICLPCVLMKKDYMHTHAYQTGNFSYCPEWITLTLVCVENCFPRKFIICSDIDRPGLALLLYSACHAHILLASIMFKVMPV